ncbi:ATP/GTP-binding protein [Streptomyces sp. NPDC050523]|uniref:ATP/GTP-binding protein n=1 Tax=Streptomyces sp. NPDC050523 TaxID=3365622 RepID=UPI003796F104
MLSRAAAAAAACLAGLLGPTAYASDGPGVGNTPTCEGAPLTITVCAQDGSRAPGRSSADIKGPASAARHSRASGAPKCAYTRLDPQPPADNLGWDGHTPDDDGAVYQVNCPATGRVGLVWQANGQNQPAPQIDPETLARQAVDSMKLVGPDIASPRPAGHYVVGMPMWMWVNQGPTTYGPATATATAGGVTVTATARVSAVNWSMGDGGMPVLCQGPGTRYRPSVGLADSPDCGYRYARASAGRPGHRYAVTATSTWSITWQVQGVAGAGNGQWTETRATTQTTAVGEAQAVNS